jgi:hypothetical protein
MRLKRRLGDRIARHGRFERIADAFFAELKKKFS